MELKVSFSYIIEGDIFIIKAVKELPPRDS